MTKISEREQVYQLLDPVPDSKIAYVIGYIQGLTTVMKDVPSGEQYRTSVKIREVGSPKTL